MFHGFQSQWFFLGKQITPGFWMRKFNTRIRPKPWRYNEQQMSLRLLLLLRTRPIKLELSLLGFIACGSTDTCRENCGP